MNAPVRGSRPRSRDARTWQPKEESGGERAGGNGTGAPNGDEPGGLRSGRNPWTVRNPGRGSGMKEAREAESGASRRGAEKARGRNEAERWEPPRVWTLPVMSRRGQEPRQDRTYDGPLNDGRHGVHGGKRRNFVEDSETRGNEIRLERAGRPVGRPRQGTSPETGSYRPFAVNPIGGETIDQQRPAVG